MRLKIAGALAVLIIGLSCGANQQPGSDAASAVRASPVQTGETAPDFTLEDQHNQKVSLSSGRGTPAILVFYRGYW